MISSNNKFGLTIKEATEYFGVGENKLRELAKIPGCDFVLRVGKKQVIKRAALEKYLSNRTYV